MNIGTQVSPEIAGEVWNKIQNPVDIEVSYKTSDNVENIGDATVYIEVWIEVVDEVWTKVDETVWT